MISIDRTLPQNLRDQIWNAVVALCLATGVDLLNQNMSELNSAPTFKVWHFSFYGKYGQSVSFSFLV